MSRWEQARTDATTTTEKVNEQVQSVGDSVAKDWNARKAKIAADMDALKAKVVRKKRELDARLAEKEADRLEEDAHLAIDYAIAAVTKQGWPFSMPSRAVCKPKKLAGSIK